MSGPAPDGRVSDAVAGHWADRATPRSLRPYLRLARIERPIGWWLLLLPCWWSAALAAIAAGDVEESDRLGRAHADQIVRQIRALLARERRDDPPL